MHSNRIFVSFSLFLLLMNFGFAETEHYLKEWSWRSVLSMSAEEKNKITEDDWKLLDLNFEEVVYGADAKLETWSGLPMTVDVKLTDEHVAYFMGRYPGIRSVEAEKLKGKLELHAGDVYFVKFGNGEYKTMTCDKTILSNDTAFHFPITGWSASNQYDNKVDQVYDPSNCTERNNVGTLESIAIWWILVTKTW